MEQKSIIDYVANMIKNNKDFIFEKGKVSYEKELVKSTKAFEEYYITAIAKYSRLKNIINNAQPVNLSSIYVPIHLECNCKCIGTESLRNILRIDKNIIISGVGGSGKSTLLKYLFKDAFNYADYIPIFIELKNLNSFRGYNTDKIEDEEEYIIEYIYMTMKKFNFDLDKKSLIYALKKAPIILFLDGFDEINNEIDQIVSNGIINLSIKYTNLKVIMTSRQIEEGFISWSNFTEMKMKKLSKDQSLEVINRTNYDNETKERFLLELEENLYDSHESFASNPLLVIIMLLTFSEFAEIPEKIYLFYQEAFEVMFRKHDAAKDGSLKRTLKSKLSKDDFESVLACFAWLGYNERNLEFHKEELIDYMKKCRKITDINFKENHFINDLTTSVCILNLEGRIYSYSHRSFQEYFTAVFILHSTEEIQSKLINNLIKTSLRDSVLDLLFEMNSSVVEKQVIIPTLSELYKITEVSGNDPDDLNFINYCNLIYDRIGWDDIRFRCATKAESKKYFAIMDFVRRKYIKDFPRAYARMHDRSDNRVMERFEPKMLYSNEELKNEFLERFIRMKERYCLTYKVLNKLIKKHKSKLDIVEELILIKDHKK